MEFLILFGIIAFILIVLKTYDLVYEGWDKGIFTLDKNKIHLVVLGLPQTGKTLFFNVLKDKWDPKPDQTNTLDKANMRLEKDGKSVWIKAIDYGGDDNFFREKAKELIKQSDFIVYFCNIEEYCNNPDKAATVRARLQYIFMMMNKENTNVHIVLSYADKVNSREKALKSFVQSIAKEDFAKFGHNVVAINMENKSEVKQMITRLFHGK